MTRRILLCSLSLLALAIVLAACSRPEPTVVPTIAPSRTYTPSPPPTSTPTPTPTARPIDVTGDLRIGLLTTPVAQRGALCGVVDTLDFPAGPPDGAGYNARWSFGRYSSRYNGIHTGEDWVRNSGNSLGEPVYSIGHGTVTYAQPLGWGIDRGVVIVRHIFPDGSSFLSFYGHLDPPSVVLGVGDCVARGDMVGRIGQPRGRPHLHFEIRTHTPDAPGPGYWSVDPRRAGWKVPSDTIWDYRIQISPGVMWTRPFTATESSGIGLLADGALAALDGQRLIGVDPEAGRLRWSLPMTPTIYQSAIDAGGDLIYLSDHIGSLEAIDASGVRQWSIEFGAQYKAALMPLPGSGVAAYVGEQLVGVSTSGERLWQIDLPTPPFAWTLTPDQVVFTVEGKQPILYGLDQAGRLDILARITGRPLIAGGQIFIHNPTGLYRLEAGTGAARLVYPLDNSALSVSRAVALSDGSIAIAHQSVHDRRLIWIDADGAVRWDRSLASVGLRLPLPIVAGGQLYVMTSDGDVLQIDPLTGDAWRTFEAGGGMRLVGDVWALATTDGRILLDFRGGEIVALDPSQTTETAGSQ